MTITEIDNLTDRAGMGDKYDDKINKFADGQINNQVSRRTVPALVLKGMPC